MYLEQVSHFWLSHVFNGNYQTLYLVEVYILTTKQVSLQTGQAVALGHLASYFTVDGPTPQDTVNAYLLASGKIRSFVFISYMILYRAGTRFDDGTPLSRPAFVRELRAALMSEGIDASKYADHSFRIGAATTVAAVGIEDSL